MTATPQIVVTQNTPPAIPGGWERVWNELAVQSQVAIDAGLFMVAGTLPRTATAPTSAASITNGGLGITPSNAIATPGFPSSQTTEYFVGAPLGLMAGAICWVRPEVLVAVSDPVYARYAANGPLTTLGALRNNGDSSHAGQVAAARFLDATTAVGQLARIWINCPSGT